ncbi:MAG: hypothetical protein HZA10_09590 [Nitrospirae bacterium]|nr:hypothetical protein [Nitrospirota bacterium]
MNETEKLKHLIEHWIEHNDAHVKTYLEWASKAELLGGKKLAEILTQIAAEAKKQDELFKKALNIA